MNITAGHILIGLLLATMIAITAISILSGDLTEPTCNLGQSCR